MATTYDKNDIVKVWNGFGNTYGNIVDYFNEYFSGQGKEHTKIDYNKICTTNGIDISPLIDLFIRFIDRHDKPESFLDEIENSLNDSNNQFHEEYEILVYYINIAHMLERDIYFALTCIHKSNLIKHIAEKSNTDVNDKEAMNEVVRVGIQTLDSLRDLVYTVINYGFLMYLSGMMENKPSSLKRLTDNKFFYKEVRPALTGIFSYTGTLIIETPLRYYNEEMQNGVLMKRYTIFCGNSSRIASSIAITYIEDVNGYPVNDFQIVSIDDYSYFRTTIGNIIPDHLRCIMGMGHAKNILNKDRAKSYLRTIVNKICSLDEEVDVLVDTLYSFNTIQKKEIFGKFIANYGDKIEFSINELDSIRIVNGEDVMKEDKYNLHLILNRPEILEEFIKPLEESV